MVAVTSVEAIASQAVDMQTFAADTSVVNDKALAQEFETMLADPSMMVTPAEGANVYQVESGVSNPFHIDTTPTIGENIMDVMQGVREQMDGNFAALDTTVQNIDVNSVADLVGLQYEVIRFSFELDMTTKIAGQMSSHTDRFLNQQ